MRKSGEWRVASGEWKNHFTHPSSLIPHPSKLRESDYLKPGDLNKSPKPLISLTIILTKAVDKAVDKLWISCG
jgi:hypothetical protein